MAPASIFQSFLGRDALQGLDDLGKGKCAEMKMLRAGADRIDQIFGLRGGHDEDHFFGRLFQRFEQRVRSFVGKHVSFVENDDLVASAHGRISDHFAQLTDLIDAPIGSGVDFGARQASFPAAISRHASHSLQGERVGP